MGYEINSPTNCIFASPAFPKGEVLATLQLKSSLLERI